MGAFLPMHLLVLAIAGFLILFAGALLTRLVLPLARPLLAPKVAPRDRGAK